MDFWPDSWTNPKQVPDDYDLKIDGQAEKFLDLKQKLTYFLITASIAPIGFALTYTKDSTSNLLSKWLLLVAGGLAGLLAAGFALICLHFEIGSYRKHIKYRYLRKTWEDVPKQEQDAWEKDNHWAASFLKYSFLALFIEIAVLVAFLMTLLHSKATSEQKGPDTNKANTVQTLEIFDATGTLPAFVQGSPSRFEADATEPICRIRQVLRDHHSPTAIVIGGSDRRELSRAASLQSGSNSGLAQKRADLVAALLQNRDLCTSAPVQQATALIRGPRHTDLRIYRTTDEREQALADDRRVEVKGFELNEAVRRQ